MTSIIKTGTDQRGAVLEVVLDESYGDVLVQGVLVLSPRLAGVYEGSQCHHCRRPHLIDDELSYYY